MRAMRWLVAVVAAFSLACCAQPAARNDAATPAATPAPHASSGEAGTFAHLNALQREAAKLKTPLAVYLFWRDQYVHGDAKEQQLVGQVLAAAASEVGAYDEAVQRFPYGVTHLHGKPAPLPAAEDYRAIDAAPGIAELARDRHIVMINEAHHAAQTRLVTLALLPRLRAQGFTHFAVEALDERDRELAQRGYPISTSGTYVREPLYGELIRTALKLGFILVPYESARVDADTATREEEQAQHLVERVFRTQPDARLFVHAGYAHVHKRNDYLFDTDTMAMRLQRKTGFDPLSIDQTMLRPIDTAREYPERTELLRRFPVARPSILVSRKDGAAWSLEPAMYDVSVLLPPAREAIVGRPGWLTLDGERKPTGVALDLSAAALPVLIEARFANESDRAVPADRALVERQMREVVLFLRPGSYRITAINAAGNIVNEQHLRVDADATAQH